METKIKLTGLWRGENRNGEAYFSGSVNPTMRLLIFKNNHKGSERDPDLIAYLVPVEKKPAVSADPAEESPRRRDQQDVPF